METNQKKLISEFVKNGRLSKGLTQKELSERTNVSVRSIQRIENAELIPRSYTLKTIAEALGISFDSLHLTETEKTSLSRQDSRRSKAPRLILSIGLSLIIIFLAAAFVFQSPGFPETAFESMLFWTAIVALITSMLFLIWRKR
jgi:transcriptional regulator with XRE-family HTH domain